MRLGRHLVRTVRSARFVDALRPPPERLNAVFAMSEDRPQQSAEEVLIATRRAKAEKIRARGGNPFANDIVPQKGGKTLDVAEVRARAAGAKGEGGKYAEDKVKEAFGADGVHVRGRVVAFRSSGGLSFIRLRDRTGEIQLLISEA